MWNVIKNQGYYIFIIIFQVINFSQTGFIETKGMD